MITLTSLSKIYRTNEIETIALENVDLGVDRDEFPSVMRPSGCDESTLLDIMGLLDTPITGTIEINDTHTKGMKDKELAVLRNRTFGFVFQSFHLINSLNILDNVELPLLYHRIGSSERRKQAQEVPERIGLTHRMWHFPTRLPGGQYQRVAITRAVIDSPEIILADEPTSNLDSKIGAGIMELLRRLSKEDGHTIVMAAHNEEQTKQASRTIRFFNGQQVQ